MSSASWIYNARRFNYPLPQKLQQLIAKFNQLVIDSVNDDGGEELSIRSDAAIGRSILKFCDTDLTRLDNGLTQTIVSTISSCPTYEPDHNYCKLIIEFNNVGGYIPDYSGFNHNAQGYGVGRIRYGIPYAHGSLSIESVFDGRTNWAKVPDHVDLDFTGVQFTLMFRFTPFDLYYSSVHRQAIIAKKDADGSWYCFELATDGSAYFNMYVANSQKIYSIQIPAGTIVDTAYEDTNSSSTRYDVVITWDYITETLILYLNNYAFTTVTNSITLDNIVPDYEDTDLMIGRWSALVGRPVTLPQTEDIDPIRLFSKLYFGMFQQLKYFKGKILTATEVSHHYTNKLSITDCAFGEIAIPSGSLILT